MTTADTRVKTFGMPKGHEIDRQLQSIPRQPAALSATPFSKGEFLPLNFLLITCYLLLAVLSHICLSLIRQRKQRKRLGNSNGGDSLVVAVSELSTLHSEI
jgi:hypothetical protein